MTNTNKTKITVNLPNKRKNDCRRFPMAKIKESNLVAELKQLSDVTKKLRGVSKDMEAGVKVRNDVKKAAKNLKKVDKDEPQA